MHLTVTACDMTINDAMSCRHSVTSPRAATAIAPQRPITALCVTSIMTPSAAIGWSKYTLVTCLDYNDVNALMTTCSLLNAQCSTVKR